MTSWPILSLNIISSVCYRLQQQGTAVSSSSKLDNDPQSPVEDNDDDDLINPGSPNHFDDDASEDESALELRSPISRLKDTSDSGSCRRSITPEAESPNDSFRIPPHELGRRDGSSSASPFDHLRIPKSPFVTSNGFPFFPFPHRPDLAWDATKFSGPDLFLPIPQTTESLESSHLPPTDTTSFGGPFRASIPSFPSPILHPFGSGLPPRLPFPLNSHAMNSFMSSAPFPLSANPPKDTPSYPHSLSIESLISPHKPSTNSDRGSSSPPAAAAALRISSSDPSTFGSSIEREPDPEEEEEERSSEIQPEASGGDVVSKHPLNSPGHSPASKRQNTGTTVQPSAASTDLSSALNRRYSEQSNNHSFQPIRLQLGKEAQ